MTIPSSIPRPGLSLEYPRSLGVYDKYEQAQKVVDYLSDHQFEVQNMAIVGTELKTIERVTGRLTRGRVAAASTISGAWMGLFVGLAFALFGGGSGADKLGFVITVVIFGAIFGLVWSQIGFSAVTRNGSRDFSSVTQVVATKYEVLVEHRFAEAARDLLAKMPGGDGGFGYPAPGYAAPGYQEPAGYPAGNYPPAPANAPAAPPTGYSATPSTGYQTPGYPPAQPEYPAQPSSGYPTQSGSTNT